MTTLKELSGRLKNSKNRIKSNVQSVLYAESDSLISDFKDRSPVDSGEYRSNWERRGERFSNSNMISSVVIRNRTPYAHLMEFGSEKHSYPWYYPRKGRGSGKLRVISGRVWAGGLRPGHRNTFGGAIDPVLMNNTKRLRQLTTRIADAVIGGIL